MALIVPKFRTAVDAAIHADKFNLRDFVIQKATNNMFVIYLISGERLVPYTTDQPEGTV